MSMRRCPSPCRQQAPTRTGLSLFVYERLQDETAAAVGVEARRLLELGTGTGETARRVLARNPAATLLGLDASREMLDHAAAALPAARVDVVFSALTIHHLDGPGKADLFQRVAYILAPGGRFVLGDVVVPQDPADVVTPIDPDYDKPSTVAEQLRWLSAAGLRARLAWAHRDLAVLVGQAPPAIP
jgi:tRNA (cmo5U34)-methyltransferase